jgi:hydrogenase maturation factor HypE
VPLNTWTHLALTYDGATMRMFVNGAQVSTKAVTGSAPVTAAALRIGGDSVWGEYFKGLIDEVRIYNRALNGGEIQTDMNTPIP